MPSEARNPNGTFGPGNPGGPGGPRPLSGATKANRQKQQQLRELLYPLVPKATAHLLSVLESDVDGETVTMADKTRAAELVYRYTLAPLPPEAPTPETTEIKVYHPKTPIHLV